MTGYARLALEYGIRLDESAFKAMIASSSFGEGDDFMGATMAGWFSSPEDWATSLKNSLLDDGKSPMEEMQRIADQVEAYKARH